MKRLRIPCRPRIALVLLLGINLFNYIDRQILAAVQPQIRDAFFGADAPETLVKMGSLATAFLVSYMLTAPLFGLLADRMSRWVLVGLSVLLWSFATSGSGLASTFNMLLLTRMLVGIGEAGYGPAAPTIISDLYPVEKRGQVLAWFYMAIPVGSALGYALGGFIAQHWSWRMAFLAVTPPGLLLGALALFVEDPARGQAERGSTRRSLKWSDYLVLLRTPSYVLDTLGMTAMSFAIGGISYFMPDYLLARKAGDLSQVNVIFGLIIVAAGIAATLLGGIAGDAMRKRWSGSYFIVSAIGIFLACPMILAILWVPFPLNWGVIFLAVFFLFFNTGPSNTILANVTHPAIRATGFAMNILIIHAFGDAISPPLLGKIVGPHQTPEGLQSYWNSAFFVVAVVTAIGGVFWIWGARYLQRDMELAMHRLNSGASVPVVAPPRAE